MKKIWKVLLILLGIAALLLTAFFILKGRTERSLIYPVGEAALFEERAQYVQVGEERHTVRYIAEGEGDEDIIFIHGLGATSYTWRHLIDLLGEDYRVYAVDLIGFGMSDKPDANPSPGFFADFITDFMDAVGIEKAHLVGNSLGGATAAAAALWHPERVDKIVLIGAGGYDEIAEHRPFFVKLSQLPVIGEGIILLSVINPQGIVRSTLKESAFTEEFIDDDLVHEFARAFVTPGYRRFILRFTRDFRYEELENSLNQIEHEALLLWGAEDNWIPVKFAHRFHEDLPNSVLKLIENCGHEPQEEYPELTAEIIRDFFR